MILLDTNVISALMRATPELPVIGWLNRQHRSSIWTTTISVYETRFGLELMPAGKRRAAMSDLFERILSVQIEGRIAVFDEAAARHAADYAVLLRNSGRPGDIRDTMIAGIVLATGATLATRNTRHFEEIASSVVNPWGLE
jgi:predicted nucleic acid-binding protein